MGRPRRYELAALLELVGASVGPFDRAADLMAHRPLDDRVRHSRDFLGPSPERRPEAMGCNLSGALKYSASAYLMRDA